MKATASSDVRHDPERGRFYAGTGHGEARLEYRRMAGDILDLRHTFVPAEDRGQGIAGRLVQRALEYAGEEGLQIIPTCPFVRSWLEGHPRFHHLVAED